MDNKIFITDENGKEMEMNILFTFENEDKKYVVVYPNGAEDDIYALQYDEDGNMFVITDEEELEMVQEVVDAYYDVEDEEDE